MQKVIRIIFMVICLIINTICDIKLKKLPLAGLLGFGVIGIIVNLILSEHSFSELLLGVAVGGALIVISYVTEGQIGEGDGLLFMVTGLFIGGMNNICLLLWSSVLCAFVAGILLMTKQLGRKDRLPFAPFVLLAYVGQVLL